MDEYTLDIALSSRRASGEPGPRVPVFEPYGRLPRIMQLRALENVERAIASGQTDAERIELTNQYAARANAQEQE